MIRYKQTLIGLLGIAVLLAACVTPPAVAPEPQKVFTATPAVSLPSLTAAPPRSLTPTESPPTLTATPTATAMTPAILPPSKLITDFATLPFTVISDTSTLSEQGVSAGGYTFSLPQEVPDGLGAVDIVGWLPGSSNEIVAIHQYRVVAIDVYSGRVRQFSQPSEYPISPASVRLLANGQVGFATYNRQAQTSNDWWISGADDERAAVPITGEAHPYPILAPDRETLLVYDIQTARGYKMGQDGKREETEVLLDALLTPLTARETSAQQPRSFLSATSAASRWVAVYNFDHFQLLDFATGEVQEVRLWPGDWVLRIDSAHWSPDGQRLALLVTSGEPPIPYMRLFILDVASSQMTEIRTDLQYITNVTWTPDNTNLLITADTGTAWAEAGYDYETGSLFFVDMAAQKVNLLSLLPESAAIGFTWNLSWSPDGMEIVLAANKFVSKSDPQLYRIDVGFSSD